MAVVQPSAVPNYFDEMLKYIRDTRASERRFYLRVKAYKPIKNKTPL